MDRVRAVRVFWGALLVGVGCGLGLWGYWAWRSPRVSHAGLTRSFTASVLGGGGVSSGVPPVWPAVVLGAVSAVGVLVALVVGVSLLVSPAPVEDPPASP